MVVVMVVVVVTAGVSGALVVEKTVEEVMSLVLIVVVCLAVFAVEGVVTAASVLVFRPVEGLVVAGAGVVASSVLVTLLLETRIEDK